MRYAVIYQSESGNTKKIAEEIFKNIESSNKELCDLDNMIRIPRADIYFIGFAIHNGNCSMDVIECLEETGDAKYALFATCGYTPSEKYKQKLMKNLDVWLPEEGEFLGMFLCQGKVDERQKSMMLDAMPEAEERLEQMFGEGELHPNEDDLKEAAKFTAEVQNTIIYEEE